MKSERNRIWIVIVLTGLTALVVFWADRIEPVQNKVLFKFPLTIGDWKGEEIPMGANIYASLETPYAFLRNYRSPRYDYPVNLSIVWFDDRNIAFHAPEACLGGIGNYVKEKSIVKVKINRQEHAVGRLVVELNGMRQLVLSYYDADGYITTSQAALRMTILSKRLVFQRSSASFIRLMAPIEDSDVMTMLALQDFLDAISPLIREYTNIAKIKQAQH